MTEVAHARYDDAILAAARAKRWRPGLTGYPLDPAMGCAQFLHKWLD